MSAVAEETKKTLSKKARRKEESSQARNRTQEGPEREFELLSLIQTCAMLQYEAPVHLLTRNGPPYVFRRELIPTDLPKEHTEHYLWIHPNISNSCGFSWLQKLKVTLIPPLSTEPGWMHEAGYWLKGILSHDSAPHTCHSYKCVHAVCTYSIFTYVHAVN